MLGKSVYVCIKWIWLAQHMTQLRALLVTEGRCRLRNDSEFLVLLLGTGEPAAQAPLFCC